MQLIDEAWPVVTDDNGCHRWQGYVSQNGYGMLTQNRQTVYAHRVSYERHVGEIPDGLHIDHLCKVRDCVNPGHLEPVTQAENNRRAADTGYCKNGHIRTEENTRIEGGYRRCLDCLKARRLQRNAQSRAWSKRNRDKRNAMQRAYRHRKSLERSGTKN